MISRTTVLALSVVWCGASLAFTGGTRSLWGRVGPNVMGWNPRGVHINWVDFPADLLAATLGDGSIIVWNEPHEFTNRECVTDLQLVMNEWEAHGRPPGPVRMDTIMVFRRRWSTGIIWPALWVESFPMMIDGAVVHPSDAHDRSSTPSHVREALVACFAHAVPDMDDVAAALRTRESTSHLTRNTDLPVRIAWSLAFDLSAIAAIAVTAWFVILRPARRLVSTFANHAEGQRG